VRRYIQHQRLSFPSTCALSSQGMPCSPLRLAYGRARPLLVLVYLLPLSLHAYIQYGSIEPHICVHSPYTQYVSYQHMFCLANYAPLRTQRLNSGFWILSVSTGTDWNLHTSVAVGSRQSASPIERDVELRRDAGWRGDLPLII
jgi:hypothetical protein